MNTPRPWTPQEDATLREAYARGGIDAARSALPDRTTCGIFRRAQRLRISRRRRWSARDVRMLLDLWGSLTVAEIARQLGRTEATVYHKATTGLGLPRGLPQGMEYLTDAAKRTGFTTTQLRRILRATRGVGRPSAISVGIKRTMARPSASKSGRRFHCVDPIDVDDAIAQWCAQETIHHAAERLGLCDETLAAILRDAGLRPPRRRRLHWRIDSVTIDKLVAEHAARETLAVAAARVGVTRQTLAKWLREGGIAPGEKHRVFRVDPAAVDAVVEERRSRSTARCGRRAA